MKTNSRLALVGTSFLALAGVAATPALAQYYYGPAPGYGYGPPPGYGGPPPGYRPPPGAYSYNAPPPPGPEYGRPFEDDGYGRPRAPRPLSARAVVDRLEDMGYENIGSPRFTGTLYIVMATGPGGARQQLVVDAIRGVILNRTAVPTSPPGFREDDDRQPRRYGARPLDTDDLARDDDDDDDGPRVVQPRREAARPAPIESAPLPPVAGTREGALPAPADPRLAPSPEPPAARAAPRPFEGRSGGREARTEPRSTTPPAGGNARPFGVNPATPKPAPAPGAAARTKEGEERKGDKPAEPPAKPVAEARPKSDKPVRVIQGVTPLNNGEGRSQLDNLPKPPDAPAPTGQ